MKSSVNVYFIHLRFKSSLIYRLTSCIDLIWKMTVLNAKRNQKLLASRTE